MNAMTKSLADLFEKTTNFMVVICIGISLLGMVMMLSQGSIIGALATGLLGIMSTILIFGFVAVVMDIRNKLTIDTNLTEEVVQTQTAPPTIVNKIPYVEPTLYKK